MSTDLFEAIEAKLDSAMQNTDDATSRQQIREAHQFVVCLQDRLEREHGG